MCGIVELYVLSFSSRGESSLPHSEMGTAYLQRFDFIYVCCPPQLCLYDAEQRIIARVSTNSKRRIAMTSNNMYTARVLVWMTLTQQLFLAASEKLVLSKCK